MAGTFDISAQTAVRFAEVLASKSDTKFDKDEFLANFNKGLAAKGKPTPVNEERIDRVIDNFKARETRKYYPMSLFVSEDIKTFTFSNWKALTAEHRSIGKQAFTAAKKLHNESGNYVLVGRAGTGKTALSVAMLNELVQVKSVMFVNLVNLRSMMLASIDDDRAKQDYNMTIRGMKEVEVLVMDDFGKESGVNGATDKMTEILYNIINARIGKSTIVTTNDNLNQLAAKYDESLISRLIPKDENKIILFQGINDYREA